MTARLLRTGPGRVFAAAAAVMVAIHAGPLAAGVVIAAAWRWSR